VVRNQTYTRDESRSEQLDRSWSELVQEFRVIGTGIQILFAFLLSIAFQARFDKTTEFQRDVYLATLLASGLAAALFITPVALHRFLFHERAKDELVQLSNIVAIAGMATLTVAMIGAVLLIGDWVAGTLFAVISTTGTAVVFSMLWFAIPFWLRRRVESR
jgi:hypothetical protein